MKDILNEFRWAYQRVRFGYDNRIKWDLDCYMSKFVKPIKEFCQEWLEYKEVAKLNPKKAKIMRKTIKLIDRFKKMDLADYYKQPNAESDMWKFIGEHIGYYWD